MVGPRLINRTVLIILDSRLSPLPGRLENFFWTGTYVTEYEIKFWSQYVEVQLVGILYG